MPKKKEHRRPDNNYIEKKVKTGRILPGGKPERKSIYGKTPEEIEEKRKRLYGSLAYEAIDETITLAEWADRWLLTYKEGSVRDNTYEDTYANAVNKHIVPYFKNVLLSSVRQADIKDFYKTLSGLSQSAIEKIKISMKSIFETAVENNLIRSNPANKLKQKSDIEPEPKDAYDAAEARRVIDFAKMLINNGADIIHMAAIIAIFKTGARLGELLAFEPEHFDLKEKIVKFRQSVSYSKKGLKVHPPKSKASIADLPFDEEFKSILMLVPRHTKIVAGKGKTRRETFIKNKYVFCNSTGGLMNPRNWRERIFKPFMEEYRKYCIVKQINDYKALLPHEIRHTFGSLIYKATKDIYITSKFMRHASVEITAKIYIHDSMEDRRAAINKAYNITVTDISAQEASELVARLFELADKAKEMGELIAQLNKRFPALGLSIDFETGLLNIERTVIEALASPGSA